MEEKGESSEIEEEEVVMDTPVRSKGTQINIPITKFEESPVFNFLNSLSPIRPVKSVHISQTINSLNFTSIPSIFTSPHVATLKESRFLRRHQLGDPSKPEFSSDDVRKDDNGKAEAAPENKENISPGGPVEVCNEPPYKRSQTLSYNFGSPNSNQTSPCGLKTKLESETDGSSSARVPYVEEGYDSMFHETEMGMERSSQIDQTKEGTGCEWDSLTSDLLNFDSPNEAETSKNEVDDVMSNDMENSQVLVGPSGQLIECNDPENQFAQPGDGNELNEFTGNQNIGGVCSQNTDAIDGGSGMVHETAFNLYRGMRRRCLVFEQSGARKKHLIENTNPPILPQFDGNSMIMDKQTMSTKFRSTSPRCVLPGIGLHLNALAATSKDYKVVKNESCTSGKQLVITPSSASNHHLLNSCQDSLGKAVDVTQSDRQTVLSENGLSSQEDDGHVSDYMVNDEFKQTSPKKKRRRSDSGEGGSCKRCNCKKSKCLKLYCECFAAGLYCVEPCSCIDCFNKPSHEDTVLATRKQIESRNPLAFAPKVIRTSGPLSEAAEEYSSKTPASARHKRGCNCKKSGCLKKYCECYQGGVGCSINCRCEGCKNAFGRKDGSGFELEEVHATQESLIDGSRQRSFIHATQESLIDGSRQRSFIQGDSEHSLDSVNPATPVPFGRPMHHLPFPSKNKPPRSTFLHVGSSSAVCPSQGFVRPDVYPPPSKFDNNFGLLEDGDIPMVLQTNGSPISGIKSLSPNGKRVSSPHSIRVTSPRQRSSRKLILQSIPSFPSLTPQNDSHLSNEPESVHFTELH